MADVVTPGVSLAEVQALLPQPASTTPPSVADVGARGVSARFALADHTHASKVRKVRMQSAANGSLSWTFDPPFTDGVTPIVLAVAEVASGNTDLVNVQVVGAPTSTGCQLLVNRANRSVAALLSLTILSIPASPGVTMVHAVALEP